jgi:thiol-disulfide isomerase/thioredoxin
MTGITPYAVLPFRSVLYCVALLAFLAQGLAAETAGPAPRLANALADPYRAPKIAGIAAWLNSPPLGADQLKGKVVLIDFWTYSCINCIRTLPYLKDWDAKYRKDGLVIIGVHAPEFAFEGEKANVEKAIAKFGVKYPVAMDNDFATWRAFRNRYWPAHYLIDRQGRVVYTHFGEGEYDITENNIRALLGQSGPAKPNAGQNEFSSMQTPETYLGHNRAERESDAKAPPLHGWALQGKWTRNGEYIEAGAPGAALTLHYLAKKVFLVMASNDGAPKTVIVEEGGKSHTVAVTAAQLYDIAAAGALREGTVTLRARDAGLRMYAFTFGG